MVGDSQLLSTALRWVGVWGRALPSQLCPQGSSGVVGGWVVHTPPGSVLPVPL